MGAIYFNLMEGLAAMEQALNQRTDISRIEQCPKERQNWRTSKNRSKTIKNSPALLR